jgi:hypothetical protein
MSNEKLAEQIKEFITGRPEINRNKICEKFGIDIRKLKKVAEEYAISLPPPLSRSAIGKLTKFNKGRTHITLRSN